MNPVQRLAVLAALATLVWVLVVSLRRYFDRAEAPARFDHADAGTGRGPLLVEFTSPYCHECRVALPLLKAAALVHSTSLSVIDARERPDLASKYAIRRVPTILVVDSGGTIKGAWLGTPPESELEAALVSARNGRLTAAG